MLGDCLSDGLENRLESLVVVSSKVGKFLTHRLKSVNKVFIETVVDCEEEIGKGAKDAMAGEVVDVRVDGSHGGSGGGRGNRPDRGRRRAGGRCKRSG